MILAVHHAPLLKRSVKNRTSSSFFLSFSVGVEYFEVPLVIGTVEEGSSILKLWVVHVLFVSPTSQLFSLRP